MVKVSGAKTKVTYKKVKGNKKITVNPSTGKITVKKGTKKGTYNVKVSATAEKTSNYAKSNTKTFNVKIVVK